MLAADIQSLIAQLELITKKLVSGPLQGDWHSTLKGSGFEFHQLRDYIQGDDIRFIDWKASARSDKMLVRQYLEDRNRVVYLVIDISASMNYGTGALVKGDLMKQLATVLAFVAHHKKDSVGLVLFTDEIEKVIPPGQSRSHVLSLVKQLFDYKPRRRGTSLAAPLDYLIRLPKKAIICLISDFMGTLDVSILSLAARMHDVMAFRCLDEREKHFPRVGALTIEDAETGMHIDSDGSMNLEQALLGWHRRQREQLISAKVDCLDLIAGKSYTGPLVRFLRRRVFT